MVNVLNTSTMHIAKWAKTGLCFEVQALLVTMAERSRLMTPGIPICRLVDRRKTIDQCLKFVQLCTSDRIEKQSTLLPHVKHILYFSLLNHFLLGTSLSQLVYETSSKPSFMITSSEL